jgi:hypothetical protein
MPRVLLLRYYPLGGPAGRRLSRMGGSPFFLARRPRSLRFPPLSLDCAVVPLLRESFSHSRMTKQSPSGSWRTADVSAARVPQEEAAPRTPTNRSGQYPALGLGESEEQVAAVLAAAPADPVLPADSMTRPQGDVFGSGAPAAEAPPPPDPVDSPFRKPFASLSPTTRFEEVPSFPPSAPPSVRRPFAAGPPRRLGNCQIHRIALSPGGECVLCRREAKAKADSKRGLLSLVLLGLVLLLAFALGAFLFKSFR